MILRITLDLVIKFTSRLNYLVHNAWSCERYERKVNKGEEEELLANTITNAKKNEFKYEKVCYLRMRC